MPESTVEARNSLIALQKTLYKKLENLLESVERTEDLQKHEDTQHLVKELVCIMSWGKALL